MNKNSLAIVYASNDGHTKLICKILVKHLQALGTTATLITIDDFTTEQLVDYDKVVFGCAVRYGKHIKATVKFLLANQVILQQKRTAFFSVNLTARKPDKNTPQTSNYVKKLFKKMTWQADLLAVFAGKINYPIYNPFDKLIIRFIMWMTKGPTDPNTVVDFTDWDKVKQFALAIHEL